MRYIILSLFIAMCSLFLSGCIVVDDDCHYETRCSYNCDLYGNDCYTDRCWDEWVCEDDYHYYP